jgi:hypothetical protein
MSSPLLLYTSILTSMSVDQLSLTVRLVILRLQDTTEPVPSTLTGIVTVNTSSSARSPQPWAVAVNTMLGLQVPEMNVLVSTGLQSSSATTRFVTHSVAVAFRRASHCNPGMRRWWRYQEGRCLPRTCRSAYRCRTCYQYRRIRSHVALHNVRISVGELLESVAGVFKGWPRPWPAGCTDRDRHRRHPM